MLSFSAMLDFIPRSLVAMPKVLITDLVRVLLQVPTNIHGMLSTSMEPGVL